MPPYRPMPSQGYLNFVDSATNTIAGRVNLENSTWEGDMQCKEWVIQNGFPEVAKMTDIFP